MKTIMFKIRKTNFLIGFGVGKPLTSTSKGLRFVFRIEYWKKN